jgi:hypothetical protein
MLLRARANHVFPQFSRSRSEGVVCGIVFDKGSQSGRHRRVYLCHFCIPRVSMHLRARANHVFPQSRPSRSEGLVCGIVFDRGAQSGRHRRVYPCHFCIPGVSMLLRARANHVFPQSSPSRSEGGGYVV